MTLSPQRKLLPRRLLDMPLSQFPNLWQEFETGLENIFNEQPGLTIYEEKDQVIVEAPMPGLKSENIEVNFSKGILWIKGEQKEAKEDKEKRYYSKSERTVSFMTSLPEQVEDKEPAASYKDGILRIVFKKAMTNEKKRIPVKQG